MKGRYLFWLTFVFFLLLDQLSKIAVLNNFKEGQSLPVIKNFFHLTLVRNTGIAFGLLKGVDRSFFIASALVIAVAIVGHFLYRKPEGYFLNISLGLVFAGALGNLIDRIIRGRVIDFFDFKVWPVFNIADSSIVVGIICLVLVYTFMNEKLPDKST